MIDNQALDLVSLISDNIYMSTVNVIIYTTSTGKQPFVDWQRGLDPRVKAVVIARIARVKVGNLGDCKIIKGGGGVWELRISYGAGYRIYFGKTGTTIVVLLAGGDKGSQVRDIAKVKRYWLTFKESHE